MVSQGTKDDPARKAPEGAVVAGGRQNGQSLIETCLSVLFLSFILAALFQVARVFAAQEIVQYAASCGARAKTVGFNRWMVEKTTRCGAIANAGRMTTPEFVNQTPLRDLVRRQRPGQLWSTVLGLVPHSAQFDLERTRIPEYLDTYNRPRADHILNYEDWDSVRFHVDADSGYGAGGGVYTAVRVAVQQDYRLRVPAHRAFYAADEIQLNGDFTMENHYPLYLHDLDR